jgi:hypothetical protein
MRTKDAFDPKLQKVVPFEVSIDNNGELLFQSTESDSFFKLPANIEKDQLNELLAKHQSDNEGQVNLEAQEKVLDDLLSDDEDEI